MKYTELKQKRSEDINKFESLFFAFNNAQFKEGLEKLGLKDNDFDKICSIGSGGFILKEKKQEFIDMLKRFDDELKEFKKEEKQMLDALVYELNNHEYSYTYDTTDALNALGWKLEDIEPKLLKKACKMALN